MIVQYGVLPYQPVADGGYRLLLITSRDTRRWVVPRGNPMSGLTPQQCAAREAWEEAGIIGPVGEAEAGRYHYDKRLRDGTLKAARVLLFPQAVAELHDDWPERRERERHWFKPAAAAAAVDEAELKAIIGAFVPPESR